MMKDLNKIWKAMEETAKDTLGANAEDFLSKTHLGGYTQGKNGQEPLSRSDRAWNMLTKGSKEYNTNQLALGLNQKKNPERVTAIIADSRVKKAFERGTGREFEVGERNIISCPSDVHMNSPERKIGAFPRTYVWRDSGRVSYLPSPGRSSVQPIINPIFNMMTHECIRVDEFGNETRGNTIIGSVDNDLKFFHKLYGDQIGYIMFPLTHAQPEDQYKEKVNEALVKYKGKQNVSDVWVEPVEFKKNMARLIALAERVPFTALYAPTPILSLRIYQEAINRGLAATGKYEVDWNREMKTRENGKEVVRPYREYLEALSRTGLANKGTTLFNSYMIKFAQGEDLTEEDLEPELAEARKDVSEAFKRPEPEEWEGGNGAAMEYVSPFGTGVRSGGSSQPAPKETAKKQEKHPLEEQVERELADFGDDEDEFPF